MGLTTEPARLQTPPNHTATVSMSVPSHAKLQLLLLAAVAFMGSVSGHAYLAFPPARNFLISPDYCPHCLSAGGPWVVGGEGTLTWPAGKHGICGDPWNGPRVNEAGGAAATGKAAATLTAGSVTELKVQVTAVHKGGFIFRICDLKDPSPGAEKGQLTEECLNQHVLQRADGSGPWSWIGSSESSGMTWTGQYRIPADLACERCVMQFRYLTGNSCKPPGAPSWATSEAMPTCGSMGPGVAYPEEFWNCADVRIIGGSGGRAPATTPTPTPVPAKPASKPAPKGWWELPTPKLCSTRPTAPICVCRAEPLGQFGVRTRDGHDCRPCWYTCTKAGTTSSCCPDGRLFSLAAGRCQAAAVCLRATPAAAVASNPPGSRGAQPQPKSKPAAVKGTPKAAKSKPAAAKGRKAAPGCGADDAACHCRGAAGSIPSPSDCGAYFECGAHGAWARSCPAGTRFHIANSSCELEVTVACGGRPL